MSHAAASLAPCQPVRADPEATARLELRALERMAVVLCEYVEQLAHQIRETGRSDSRETDLQLAVFAERRAAAERALAGGRPEPAEVRIARLQKVVEALDCSRAFFRQTQPR
jgi:hypothetical protein